MRRLVLMRHAEAEGGGRGDERRALTPRGRREAAEVGRALAAEGLRAPFILASGARRAAETARLLAAAFGPRPPEPRLDDGLYLAPPELLLRAIEGIDDGAESLVVVAHEPGISALARRLDPGSPTAFGTAWARLLELECPSWGLLEDRPPRAARTLRP